MAKWKTMDKRRTWNMYWTYLLPRNRAYDHRLGFSLRGISFNFRNEEEYLLYKNMLKCWTNRNKNVAPVEELVSNRGFYWSKYMGAKDCRDFAKFIRERLNSKTVYIVDKPYIETGTYSYQDKESPITIVSTKHPYKEDRLFLEALCGTGIKQINLGRKRILLKLCRFLENCSGFWEN